VQPVCFFAGIDSQNSGICADQNRPEGAKTLIQMTKSRTMLVLFAAATLLAVHCKDKGGESTSTENQVATVELTGTAANKMITVMDMGVKALQSNASDPAKAAAELSRLMKSYDITAIRNEAKAAKEAGQGATEEEKARFKELTETYKKLATEVGQSNPAAFNAAHTEWSRLWSIN